MPTIFLAVAALGAAFTLNALRPVPGGSLVSVPSFFAGWITSELAPHNLVLHVAATAGFVAAGGLHGWQGSVALALATFSAAGLVALVVQAHAARGVMERALVEALGEGYEDAIAPHTRARYDLRAPWRQLVLPLRMRHPDVERVRDLRYSEFGRRGLLDVYRPRDHRRGCPVLLQVHGGGWTSWSYGRKDHQGLPLMLHLASRGWVCVAPNYRVSPRATFPDHLVDLKRAIAWIHEHGGEYGADPRFIAVTGGSAGGHLAALVALTANDPEYQPGFEGVDTSVRACVPYYGVYDFTNSAATKAGRRMIRFFLEPVVMKRRIADDPEAFAKASPLHRVREDAPPFFVIHGTHDTLAPAQDARRFVQRLRAVSHDVVAHAELPGAQHAFDVFASVRTAHVIRGVERFLDWVFTRWAGAGDAPQPSTGAHAS